LADFTTIKECMTCREVKPLTDFYRASSTPRKDGTIAYKAQCKSCENKASWQKQKARRELLMPMHSMDYTTVQRAPKLPLSTSDDPEVAEALKITAESVKLPLDNQAPNVLDFRPEANPVYSAAQAIIKSGDELGAIQKELDEVKNMLRETEQKYQEAKQRWLDAVNVIKQYESINRG